MQSRMWLVVDNGYRYNDWDEWSGAADKPRTLAARLVKENIPPEHPSLVRDQLVANAAGLLEEGQETAVVVSALKLWNGKPGMAPSLLAHLVSDAVRKQGEGDLLQLIRDCWKSGDVTPLRHRGYWFEEPDLPPEVKTAAQTRVFMTKKKREWLTTLKEKIA